MHRRQLLRVCGLACLMSIALIGAVRGQAQGPLASLQFLLGTWEGVGDQEGATGGFSFASSVQDRVIVRTNTPTRRRAAASPRRDTIFDGDLRGCRTRKSKKLRQRGPSCGASRPKKAVGYRAKSRPASLTHKVETYVAHSVAPQDNSLCISCLASELK